MRSKISIRILYAMLLSLLCNVKAQCSVSDSLHVTHYRINIDSINFTAHTIKASCSVTIQAKQNNVTAIPLSLLKLTVDSVKINGSPVAFSYDDTTILIPAPSPMQLNDSLTADIYYHGSPVQDASGWGGFYFSATHAFNMGVGFAADPHNYGKAWFPCIDEFTDHSRYDFYITTASNHKPFCNGILAGSVVNPNNTVTWHWQMNQPIASYLASIAVSNYYTLKRTSNNLNIEWACAVSDTPAVLNTFQHVDTILGSFITAYGAYPFDKVGYALVPFNSGAMEHATSIHIGSAYMSGLTYETLWAHELSHMWWGDKVTCETAGDMWLNEGFASFNEAFMTEKVYGDVAYKNWLRSNNKHVLQFGHIEDGSYLSFLNVPHAYTYGTTVYKKAANVIHTMRNYMGDSAFFNGCKHYLNSRAFSTGNSYELRDDLTASSGINMNRFFDDWIFTEGFPHFSIDSVVYMPGGLDHYFVYVRQRSKGNNHIYSMPVEINFRGAFMDTTITVQIDSATQMFHCPLLGIADMTTLDRNEKISDAITDYEKTISATGTSVFPETNTSLNTVSTGGGSSLVRIEHNWVTPDGWKQSNPGIRISDYHYWRIDGILQPGFDAQVTFSYNGSNSATNGYLDNTLITTREDSLVLLYRSGTGNDWQILTNVTLTTGASALDKVGSIKTDSLMKGEYALGYRDYTVSVPAIEKTDLHQLTVTPNPSRDTFDIHYQIQPGDRAMMRITSSTGQQILERKLDATETIFKWNAANNATGNYTAQLIINNVPVDSVQLIHIK